MPTPWNNTLLVYCDVSTLMWVGHETTGCSVVYCYVLYPIVMKTSPSAAVRLVVALLYLSYQAVGGEL